MKLTINVVDENGRPVMDARVAVWNLDETAPPSRPAINCLVHERIPFVVNFPRRAPIFVRARCAGFLTWEDTFQVNPGDLTVELKRDFRKPPRVLSLLDWLTELWHR